MSEASAPAEIQSTFRPDFIKDEAKAVVLSTEAVPNLRQQRKIIACLIDKGPILEILGKDDVNITTKEHKDFKDFINNLNNETNKQEKIDQVLSSISTPLDLPADDKKWAEIVANLEGNSQGRAFLAHSVGKGMEQRNNLPAADVLRFFENNPLPSTLETMHVKQFLDELEKVNDTNGPQKRSEYEKSITLMMRAIYGKRMEYWEQYKLLRQQSEIVPSSQQVKHDLKKIPEGVEVADYIAALKEANLKARGH